MRNHRMSLKFLSENLKEAYNGGQADAFTEAANAIEGAGWTIDSRERLIKKLRDRARYLEPRTVPPGEMEAGNTVTTEEAVT